MKTSIFALLASIVSLSCLSAQPGTGVLIGQPTIFWHNAEWQTYKDGVWTPYGQPERRDSSRPRSESPADSSSGRLRHGIVRGQWLDKSIRPNSESNIGIGEATIGIGRPNGIGRSMGGLGQPNAGIGQTTIGIGQPNVSIGQPNGIGQTTIGIGQPNGSIGQNNMVLGQPNIGIGQPNGLGRTTIGIGKPMSFPPQQRGLAPETSR